MPRTQTKDSTLRSVDDLINRELDYIDSRQARVVLVTDQYFASYTHLSSAPEREVTIYAVGSEDQYLAPFRRGLNGEEESNRVRVKTRDLVELARFLAIDSGRTFAFASSLTGPGVRFGHELAAKIGNALLSHKLVPEQIAVPLEALCNKSEDGNAIYNRIAPHLSAKTVEYVDRAERLDWRYRPNGRRIVQGLSPEEIQKWGNLLARGERLLRTGVANLDSPQLDDLPTCGKLFAAAARRDVGDFKPEKDEYFDTGDLLAAARELSQLPLGSLRRAPTRPMRRAFEEIAPWIAKEVSQAGLPVKLNRDVIRSALAGSMKAPAVEQSFDDDLRM